MEEDVEETYFTASQAARILHVSYKTVDRWADQGWVSCLVTLGGHRRFPRRAIMALAEQMASRGALPRQG